MTEINGYLTREQLVDLKMYGYGRGNYFLTDSKGASQIDEIIRRELEEERGVVLETRRKHVTLQLSFDEKKYFTQKQWNKKLISKFIEVANEINKNSRRGAASYICAPAGVCVMDPTKTFTLNCGGFNMRNIKEIQEEIDAIYAEARKLTNKRNELYKEIREVEKSELKDFTGKYIHSEGDTVETVMTVLKQDYSAYDGKIHIEGPRIIIEQKYKDTFICNTNKDRQIKLHGDYAKLEYDLEKFKNYTTGKYPKIEEITYEQYKEYVDKFTGEMKWLANAMAWIETSDIQI